MITLKAGNNPPNGPNDAIDDRRVDEAGHPTMRKAHLKSREGRGGTGSIITTVLILFVSIPTYERLQIN